MKRKMTVFQGNVANITIEIYGISRNQLFNILKREPAPALNRGRKSIYLDTFEQRYLPRLIFSFFSQPITINPNIGYDTD